MNVGCLFTLGGVVMSVLPKNDGSRVYKQLKGRKTQNWDAIVIGSGMGGMSCAASLAKFNKKVLVLERHYIPGGFTHMFQRGKFSWDVGVHALGEMTPKHKPGKMLEWLGEGKIKMTSLGKEYDEFFWPDGLHIAFPDSKEKFIELLKEKFPEEKDKVSKYFKICEKAYKDSDFYFAMKTMPEKVATVGRKIFHLFKRDWWKMTTEEVMDELELSEKLRRVLAAQWGYFGSPPSESSFGIQALTNIHFADGAFYPEGGAKTIAAQLLAIVERAGGETLCGAEVEEIIVENNKAVGVKMKDGQIFKAKKIISAAGAHTTVGKLVPKNFQESDWAKEIMDIGNSPSYICLNLGFEGDIKTAGAKATNRWYYRENDFDKCKTWDVTKPDEECPCIYVSFPSLKDIHHDPGEKKLHTGEAVTFVPWDAFLKWQDSDFNNRGKDYDDFKQEIIERLVTQLKEEMPEVMKFHTFSELSTPLSAKHFCNADMGAIYGLEATPKRFASKKLRMRTPIKNFYMSGVDTMAVGVVSAMASGMLTAATIDPRVYGKLL